MTSSLASSLTSFMLMTDRVLWDVVSVKRCLIQEMTSSLASSLTSFMLMTDQQPTKERFRHQFYEY